MKSLVVISLTVASFMLVACVPAIDAQSAIETGIAATAQISRLETAAAADETAAEIGAIRVLNDSFYLICGVWVDGSNILPNERQPVRPGEFSIDLEASAGDHNVVIKTCETNEDLLSSSNTIRGGETTEIKIVDSGQIEPRALPNGDCSRTPRTSFHTGDHAGVKYDTAFYGVPVHLTGLYQSEVTAYLHEGAGFSLLPDANPVCDGGSEFWKIRSDLGTEGWIPSAVYLGDSSGMYTLVIETLDSGLPDISGMWINNLGWVYEISQNGSEFTWIVTHQNVTENGSGLITGEGGGGDNGGFQELQATWSDPNGSGSAAGRIDYDSNLYGIRIEWDNGVVFTREDQSSTNSGEGSPMFTVSKDTNCRYGPSASNFDIRQTIFAGESVPIVGVGKPPAQEWWLVTVKGIDCWVWKETGQSSGDTGSVLAVNPPAMPEQANDGNGNGDEGDQGDGGEDEEWRPWEHCVGDGDITIFVDPSNGKHPVTFNFYITGFKPNEELYFNIAPLEEDWNSVYDTYLTADEDGNASISLSSEASDEPGQYIATVEGECTEMSDAVFILEP